MARAENLTERKALVRQQVLDAAQMLFERDGYELTSLGSIAAEVGIGRTTLYEYFTDKEDLVATLVEATLPGVIDDLVSSVTTDDRKERFVELGRRHGRLHFQRPGSWPSPSYRGSSHELRSPTTGGHRSPGALGRVWGGVSSWR